jgi:hypothetical protein
LFQPGAGRGFIFENQQLSVQSLDVVPGSGGFVVLVERNTMRYFLAIDAFPGAVSAADR